MHSDQRCPGYLCYLVKFKDMLSLKLIIKVNYISMYQIFLWLKKSRYSAFNKTCKLTRMVYVLDPEHLGCRLVDWIEWGGLWYWIQVSWCIYLHIIDIFTPSRDLVTKWWIYLSKRYFFMWRVPFQYQNFNIQWMETFKND